MVFQNYALWPHMTVSENVAYGLKLRKIARAEIAERVEGVLEKVKLAGLGDRYPGQLSGGQQQRVALARALVLNPEDPAARRAALQPRRQDPRPGARRDPQAAEGARHHHDLRDARPGRGADAVRPHRGVQPGQGVPGRAAASELYERPANRFVADFIGINNLIDGTVRGRRRGAAAGCACDTALGELSALRDERLRVGDRCVLCVRPENAAVDGEAGGERNRVQGPDRLRRLSRQHAALRRRPRAGRHLQGRHPRSVAPRAAADGQRGAAELPGRQHRGDPGGLTHEATAPALRARQPARASR